MILALAWKSRFPPSVIFIFLWKQRLTLSTQVKCDCKLTVNISLVIPRNSLEIPLLICTPNETIKENKFIYFIRFFANYANHQSYYYMVFTTKKSKLWRWIEPKFQITSIMYGIKFFNYVLFSKYDIIKQSKKTQSLY